MSHVVEAGEMVDGKFVVSAIRKEFLEHLVQAGTALGLEFHRDQKTHRWWGHWENDFGGEQAAASRLDPKNFGKCEHAFSVKGNANAYELGLVTDPQDKSQYLLVYDSFAEMGGALEAKMGKNCVDLMQQYNQRITLDACKLKGYQLMSEKQLADGSYEVVVDVPDYVALGYR